MSAVSTQSDPANADGPGAANTGPALDPRSAITGWRSDMNTLTLTTGLITLKRCEVRWCWHYGNDVPADYVHESDLPPITLALEGGDLIPEEFTYGDGPDSFDPADYGLPHARVTLLQHPDEDPHITINTYHVDEAGMSPRFTLDEVKQLRDQLDELLTLAQKAGTR